MILNLIVHLLTLDVNLLAKSTRFECFMPKNFDTNTQNRTPLCLQEKVGAEIANLSVIEMNLTLYNSENLKRNVYLSLWYWQRNVYVYGGKALYLPK